MGDKQRSKESPAALDLWVHAGLAALKGAAGLLTGSAALLADAVRSAAGAARAYVAVAGLRTARQPGRAAAAVHGGTGSMASAVNVAAAMLLLVAGLEIAISAVRQMINGTPETAHWTAAAVAAAALALRAAFVRGMNRTELLAGALVITGAGASWVGGALRVPVLALGDPIAALVVSLMIMVSGYRFVAGPSFGTARVGFRDDEVAAFTEAVVLVDGVIAVEELRAWEQGAFVIVDAVICVNPRISVLEGQDIARRVKEQLQKRFMHVTDVFVRVDPYDPGYPYKSNHELTHEQAPTLLQ